MTAVRAPARASQGFVLIAVLSVMALLSGLAALMLLSSRNAVATAAIASGRLDAEALLQSGVSLAAYQLFVLKRPADGLPAQQFRFDQGRVTLTVATDAGKVDLNSSGKTLLAAAYQASGLRTMTPRAFAAQVADWRDADDELGEEGAEAPQYTAIGLSFQPGNRPFRSLGDLRWVPGVTAADIRVLGAFMTVYNPRGRLSVFSAPGALIAALPGVDADTVAEVVAARRVRTAADIARLEDLLLVQASLIDAELPDTYRVGLTVQPARGGAARRVELVIAAGVSAGSAYQVLHWAE